MKLESKSKTLACKGSIEVICGSMFSGKTEELLRRIKIAKSAKKKISVFKPSIDLRYNSKKIVSHNSNSVDAIPINDPNKILVLSNKSQVVAIDEIQFFNKKIISVCNQLANNGKRVIISGLDMDFTGAPFEPMPQLLSIAEKITKVHAVCSKCGEIAHHSFRFSDSRELVSLGEKDKYTALCRNCFSNNMK